MRHTEDAPAIDGGALETVQSLKPALASIKVSCEYMGGVSRAKFYADILPLLETVKLGSRNFVVIASMDRLIEANRATPPNGCHGCSKWVPVVAQERMLERAATKAEALPNDKRKP